MNDVHLSYHSIFQRIPPLRMNPSARPLQDIEPSPRLPFTKPSFEGLPRSTVKMLLNAFKPASWLASACPMPCTRAPVREHG